MAEILNEELLFQGWNRVSMLHLRTTGGADIRRVVEDHGNAAAVLPYDPSRRVALMVRLLRAPLLHGHGIATSLEAPAGVLDGDETPEAGARREVEEEVGLTLGAVTPLGPVFSMPGISTEAIHLFLAEYSAADRHGQGGGVAEENEEIEVVEMPLATLAGMADRGELKDLKTYAMLQVLRRTRPELFA